jgi:hypothetical protein
LNEVKTQKDLLEKEEENRNSPTSSGEPSFWTGPWGITIICVGVVAVLGTIAYFIKSNSSEEGEGE